MWKTNSSIACKKIYIYIYSHAIAIAIFPEMHGTLSRSETALCSETSIHLPWFLVNWKATSRQTIRLSPPSAVIMWINLRQRSWIDMCRVTEAAKRCTPCIHFTTKAGCKHGDACRFCHLEHTEVRRFLSRRSALFWHVFFDVFCVTCP